MGLSVDFTEMFVRLFKYLFEGFVIALAAYFIPGHRLELSEIILLGLIASATFSVLDLLAPTIGNSVRSGAGYGIGFNLIGFPGAIPVL
jgi:hypothetical protein